MRARRSPVRTRAVSDRRVRRRRSSSASSVSGSAASSAIVRPAEGHRERLGAQPAAAARRAGRARQEPLGLGPQRLALGVREGLHHVAPGAHVRALVRALDPVGVPHRMHGDDRLLVREQDPLPVASRAAPATAGPRRSPARRGCRAGSCPARHPATRRSRPPGSTATGRGPAAPRSYGAPGPSPWHSGHAPAAVFGEKASESSRSAPGG